jgi:hypothetical protein
MQLRGLGIWLNSTSNTIKDKEGVVDQAITVEIRVLRVQTVTVEQTKDLLDLSKITCSKMDPWEVLERIRTQ